MKSLIIQRTNHRKNSIMIHQSIQDDFEKTGFKSLEMMGLLIRIAFHFNNQIFSISELKEVSGSSTYKLKTLLDSLLKMNYIVKVGDKFEVNHKYIFINRDENNIMIISKYEEE